MGQVHRLPESGFCWTEAWGENRCQSSMKRLFHRTGRGASTHRHWGMPALAMCKTVSGKAKVILLQRQQGEDTACRHCKHQIIFLVYAWSWNIDPSFLNKIIFHISWYISAVWHLILETIHAGMCWLLLDSAILHSWADSLCSHVILHEWLAFYSTFFKISTEVVYLQYWHSWCPMKLPPSQHTLGTPYNHAPCHSMQSHILRCMHV